MKPWPRISPHDLLRQTTVVKTNTAPPWPVEWRISSHAPQTTTELLTNPTCLGEKEKDGNTFHIMIPFGRDDYSKTQKM